MTNRPPPPAGPPIAQPAARADAAAPLALVALLIGNAVLALGPWFVRLADVGPIASGFWRLALALPVLALIAAARRHTRPRSAPHLAAPVIALVMLGGLFFGADLAFWHVGILHTRLANAALFGNISSLVFVAYGFVAARRRPNRWQAAALMLAVLGMALLMGRSFELSRANLGGDLLCVAAGLAYTGYLVAVDRVRGRIDGPTTLAIATAAAAVPLLLLAEASGTPLMPHRWWPLLALAGGSQLIGQGLLVYTIGVLPPMVVGLGLLTQPIVASTIGWLVYGERLTPSDLAGAAAIAAALVLIRRRD